MNNKVYTLTESDILNMVRRALTEARKVIRVPSSQPATPPPALPMQQQPPMGPPMGGGPMDMGAGQQMGGQDMGSGPFANNGIPDAPGPEGSEQFDHNFDAGVEADENSDPKRYIQQLTGKLSQTLNSYNGEQEDPGLNKYVAAMIIKASCKNLDDAAKKELIEKIKSAQADDALDDEIPDENGLNDGGMESDMGEQNAMPQVNEMVISKKQLMEMMLDNTSSERDDIGPERVNTKSVFTGKIFR